MRLVSLSVLLAGLAACTPAPVTPEQAAELCEDRARAAQGPTGSVSVGVNSNSGPSAGLAVGLSSDFIRGRDPVEVYESCVFDRTGAAPIRPPRLR
ncbi:hypothetical protein [Thalassorhabdomicrobium marinisediminis]|uniref:hypothetical protein n=1 Tax=Thalassorhabdomicrobium marinisediminis TaxID=2170577 RepID=UPI00248FD4D9|nr:hypothetical protein [Thalassorhabdomicrobium marinisediminis]